MRGASASAGVALSGPAGDDAVVLFERARRALKAAQGGAGPAVIAEADGDGSIQREAPPPWHAV